MLCWCFVDVLLCCAVGLVVCCFAVSDVLRCCCVGCCFVVLSCR